MKFTWMAVTAVALLCSSLDVTAQEAGPREVTTWTSKRQILGFTYEVWGQHSLGLRYMLAFEQGSSSEGLGAMSWLSGGLRPRVILGKRGTAMGGDLVVAAAFAGDAGGAAFEVTAGALRGAEQVVGVGSAGVFWSMLFVDVGYVYQFAMPGGDRPEWLARHQFGMRVNIPIVEFGRRETTEKR